MAPTNRPGIGFHRVHAEGENTSLDWRDPEHEKHVWHCSRLTVWLAEKRPSFCGESTKAFSTYAPPLRPHFVIADGIIGMEGDGPLNGAAKRMNSILLSDDPVAADFMLARLLGYEPNNVKHLCEADRFIGNHRGIFSVRVRASLPTQIRMWREKGNREEQFRPSIRRRPFRKSDNPYWRGFGYRRGSEQHRS